MIVICRKCFLFYMTGYHTSWSFFWWYKNWNTTPTCSGQLQQELRLWSRNLAETMQHFITWLAVIMLVTHKSLLSFITRWLAVRHQSILQYWPGSPQGNIRFFHILSDTNNNNRLVLLFLIIFWSLTKEQGTSLH